jgi:hypothetical protein
MQPVKPQLAVPATAVGVFLLRQQNVHIHNLLQDSFLGRFLLSAWRRQIELV